MKSTNIPEKGCPRSYTVRDEFLKHYILENKIAKLRLMKIALWELAYMLVDIRFCKLS